MFAAIRRASSLVTSLAAECGPDLWPALTVAYNETVAVVVQPGRWVLGLWRKTMNWFSRTTSIAGIQVPNYWMLVLVAVVVLWIIYSAIH